MKKSFKKYLSLVMVLMVAFVCLFSVSVSAASELVATFELGANGSASHADGSDAGATKSYTDGSYTLALTGMSKVYAGARDAKGNSCLKLGTSSVVGKFTFTVPDDVVEVKIYAAKYKANTTKIDVNGTTKTLSSASNNGQYDEITVDTSSTKTVEFKTVSGGVRCMVNTIKFYAAGDSNEPSISVNGGNFVEVGEVIKVTAMAENVVGAVVWSSSDDKVATVDQSGNVTGVAKGNVTITATVDGVSDSIELKVYPSSKLPITIANAKIYGLNEGHDTYTPINYIIEGVITKITNTTYGNLYITDGSDEILIYGLYSADGKTRYDAMTTKPVVGDKIKVTGGLGAYNGEAQMKNGCLLEIIEEDESLTSAKEALNLVDSYMSLGYKYSVSQEQGEFISEAKAAYTKTTTTNMTDGNNAAIIGLDEDVFEVKSIKGSQNNHIGLNKAGEIRLYANASDQNGASLSISTKNGQKIASVSIEFGTTVGAFTVNGKDGSKDVTEYTINDSNVTIKNVTSVNTQVWIKSITITLEVEENATVNVFSGVDFRLRLGVDNKLADIEGVEGYGIKVNSAAKEKNYLSNNEFFASDDECLYVIISLGDVLTNSERLTEEFTVRAFVVVDGVSYYSELTKTYSVASLVEYYYEVEGIVEVEPLYDLLVEMGKIN